jgi:hypothetical protein
MSEVGAYWRPRATGNCVEVMAANCRLAEPRHVDGSIIWAGRHAGSIDEVHAIRDEIHQDPRRHRTDTG